MKRIVCSVLAVTALIFMAATGAQAQKGLYVGAGLGTAGLGGDIGKDFNAGYGYQFLLGFKTAEKWAVELEYQAYEQIPDEDGYVDAAGYGGFAANVKYFFGRPRPRIFRPYFSAGLGMHAFAWRLKNDAVVGAVGEKEDGIGAIALMPGLGCEIMVGRIAALNFNGRFAFNMWGEETAEGYEMPDDWSGNALILNAGLILHL